MLTLVCQRWSERRERLVGSGTTINPAAYDVDVIEEAAAKVFVTRHHYSGTFPAARFNVGLFRGVQLVGVAVFSEGVQPKALKKWAGVPGCELGRFVLLDDVAADGESWFLRRAFALLAHQKRDIHAVLSYSDPVPRLDGAGRIVKPGHVGTIYQALSARYRGRACPRTGYMTANGAIVSGRALSKVRLEERGIDYAVDQLGRMGAPERDAFESGRDYVDRLIAAGFLRRFSHPGNHAYVFPITRRARATARGLTVQPYPKLAPSEGRKEDHVQG